MKLEDLQPGDLVEFIDKNPGSTGLSHENTYQYMGACSMKDSARGWVEAVMYGEINGEVYIRAKDSFEAKFKKCFEK